MTLIFYDFLVLLMKAGDRVLHPKRHIRSWNPLFFLTNDFLIYILYI